MLKEHNPQQAYYYQHVEQGGEDRRPRGDLHLRREGQPRAAAHRRPAPHPAQALLGGDRRAGQEARHRHGARSSRRSAPAPTGSSRSCRRGPIVYERVPDYWGKDLPVNVGSNNFDEIRYEYFRDETVELEAFKADQIDWRRESTARVLGDRLRLPGGQGQARRPRQVRGALPHRRPDARLRLQPRPRPLQGPEGARRRSTSPSPSRTSTSRSSTASTCGSTATSTASRSLRRACPKGRELETPRRGQGRGAAGGVHRSLQEPGQRHADQGRANNLRAALKLLEEAGWKLEDNRLIGPDGKQMTIEFLMNGPLYEKIALRYQQELAKIGIRLEIRPVDTSQYENRVREPRLRHHVQRLGAVDVAGQRADRVFRLASRPTARARGTTAASRTRRSMR